MHHLLGAPARFAPRVAAVRPESLSAAEARRLALRAQGLMGRINSPAGPAEVLQLLGAVQLDTISVLARSHELVCYARCGPVPRSSVEAALWGSDRSGQPAAFEYWAHAACVLPLASWPAMAFRRRRRRSSERWGMKASAEALSAVLRRLEAEGPMTATELGGAKGGGTWWDWSPVKVAVEILLDRGDVACVTRRGWRRVYDLAERAIPGKFTAGPEPTDEECLAMLVRVAGRALGVATAADLAEYFRLGRDDVSLGLAAADLAPVSVEGWDQPAWADPAAMETLAIRGRHRTTLLSPFDSVVWDRARTERIFGFVHRLEAYTPAARRRHGYYAMPVLAGGRLVGRVDPGRHGSALVAKQVHLSGRGSVTPVAATLAEAALWVGAESVEVRRCEPSGLRSALVRAVEGHEAASVGPSPDRSSPGELVIPAGAAPRAFVH